MPPQYSYTALDADGRIVRGELDAGSRSEAYQRLERNELSPVDLSEPRRGRRRARAGNGGDRTRLGEATGPGAGGTASAVAVDSQAEDEDERPPKLKRGELIYFTEELADLLEAGLHLQQALGLMAERQDSAAIRRISLRVRGMVREGEPLARSLRAASPSFDDLYINLVAAGEASGSLARVLRRLGENLTVLHELQKKFVQALIYPAMMIIACVALVIVFITVLVPQLTDLLAKTGQGMPLVTRMLIGTSAFMTRYGVFILAAVGGGAALFSWAISRPRGRLWWDRTKLGLPLIGPVIETRFYAMFCQALSNLVTNGVPLLPALRLMVRATPNVFFNGLLAGVVEKVGAGDSLSAAVRRSGHLPPLLSDMIGVGEQTGTLGKSLQKAAVRYDKELDGRIKRLTAMISPVIIIILAVVVTAVAYSIVTSIFSAVSGIRSQS